MSLLLAEGDVQGCGAVSCSQALPAALWLRRTVLASSLAAAQSISNPSRPGSSEEL
ncbi:hypothetical protein [Nocardia violaceofusca]|uniref:hypothetical protein n=1 Tax=Nocardia violaceofusca TaxID=941182 RepID=UPI0012F5161D|nr:hypothetical protein [Nocardia violaceofusca]